MRKAATSITSFLFIVSAAFAIDIKIANTSVVEGNGGQRSIEVMVMLSQPAINPVTITYTTKNGSASAGSDYVAANGSLNFGKAELMKKVTVMINGDVACESGEVFEILVTDPSGALAGNKGTITIVNDDCLEAPTYEVRLTYTGYTTFVVGPPECPIRANGKVILSGILQGKEQVGADDDILYTGVLQLDIDIDICSVKRNAAGEDRLCGMSVLGSGTVNTELEVYFDARGGYIKIENKTGGFISMVTGDCEQAEMDEETTMVPNKTIASIYNGYELTELTDRTLQVKKYVHRGDAGELIFDVIRKIR
jgi:hypothetical protein